jgi:hypothetical protein
MHCEAISYSMVLRSDIFILGITVFCQYDAKSDFDSHPNVECVGGGVRPLRKVSNSRSGTCNENTWILSNLVYRYIDGIKDTRIQGACSA